MMLKGRLRLRRDGLRPRAGRREPRHRAPLRLPSASSSATRRGDASRAASPSACAVVASRNRWRAPESATIAASCAGRGARRAAAPRRTPARSAPRNTATYSIDAAAQIAIASHGASAVALQRGGDAIHQRVEPAVAQAALVVHDRRTPRRPRSVFAHEVGDGPKLEVRRSLACTQVISKARGESSEGAGGLRSCRRSTVPACSRV